MVKYGVKDMNKLVKDFEEVDSISITGVKVSSKVAKTPEYGINMMVKQYQQTQINGSRF